MEPSQPQNETGTQRKLRVYNFYAEYVVLYLAIALYD